MKLTAILCLITFCGFSQKTKSIDIVDDKGMYITAFVNYNNQNVITDTSYYMACRNARYESIVDIVTLRRGSIEEIKSLLTRCAEAFNEEDGTMLAIDENNVYVSKYMGISTINLYGIDDDSDGYIKLKKNDITKFINKVDAYMKR